jgi:deferrochelatase/peroxidase EfeB
MSHAFVTVIAPVRTSDIAEIRQAIEKLKNPANPEMAAALDAMACIHFASLNVYTASSGNGGHLVLEFSGDGVQDDLLARLAASAGQWFRPVFEMADGFPEGGDLAGYWRSKTVTVGQGYFSHPGLVFTGTPGMSVKRIRNEAGLAREVAGILPKFLPTESALKTLQQVRDELKKGSAFDWVWQAEPTPLLGVEGPLVTAIFTMACRGICKYLWPLGLLAVAGALIGGIIDWMLRRSWVEALVVLILAFSLVLIVGLVWIGYKGYKLTQREASDETEDANPSVSTMTDLTRRENHCAQNHLDVHTVLKGEPLRSTTLRLAFFVIGQFCALQFKPGFLGSLGSIHFARWVLVPGTRDLLFFSNYGGSWESYLEDFITKAHAGLTAVWSNTIGYPRTQFLFLKGATDGDRFKRWARGKQVPTPFWYSAYPQITTGAVRNNAMIRQGLAGVSTEEEARDWLSLFGSAPHPTASLETEEMQSLIFGGLSTLQESECLLFQLNGRPGATSQWLTQAMRQISFGERPPADSALIVGVTRSLLEQCGLPAEAIATFPVAFQEGLVEPSRSRILGDVGSNHPDDWAWGGPRNEKFDGVALLYGENRERLAVAKDRFVGALRESGHQVVRQIPLKCTPPHGNRQEPFGFRDGISQPVIRGTFRSRRPFDQIHLVEAGEFILGYSDNRGYFPPTPQISPMFDPDNLLAMVPGTYDSEVGFALPVSTIGRDLGRNGSFLVIRQLEQHVEKFREFLKEAAERQFGGEPAGYVDRETWIAAKMIGRWPDGSSLVRNPSMPDSQRRKRSSARRLEDGDKHHQSQSDAGEKPDNDFLFGVEDPQGLRCPFGAHIRRANPRDSFAAGSTDQIAITNRHRILRAGRRYEERESGKEGLLFVCLNADFERQFEFIQQTWVLNPQFQGLAGEADPLFRREEGFFTIPSLQGPKRVTGLSSFVQVKGGAYFFLPGRRTLEFLARRAAVV